MLRFESVSVVYFLLLAIGAAVAPIPFHRALRGGAASCAVALFIAGASRTVSNDVRVWLPLLYLPVGYWLPAILAAAPGESRFETWLRDHDEAWRCLLGALSPLAAGTLEFAYLACYLVVPLAFVIVWAVGTLQQVERFWLAVLLAGFACYITLPWLVSRPPRMLGDSAAPRGVASFNVSLLGRVSHQFNTFPSGHVAVATAIALAVFPVSRLAGVIFGVIAVGIAAGAAAGRYHYGIDVVVGAVVGIVAAALAAL
jgi:membrane-associated phospholipid phosphatase